MPIHSLSNSIGKQQSKSLLMFHALTGCDQVSFFAGRGKKTAWETWKYFEVVTPALESLCEAPAIVDVDKSLPILEQYVVLLYDRVSACSSVDDCRKELFTKKGRSIDLCLRAEQHCLNTCGELLIRQGIAGASLSWPIQYFHGQTIGDGRNHQPGSSYPTGQAYQKYPQHAENL